MARKTSVKAYNEIKLNGLLSRKRWQVYSVLYEHGPMTGAEVSKRIKNQFGSMGVSETVRNRLTELRDAGVVDEEGTVMCPVTGRQVIQWDVNTNLPRKREKDPREILLKQIAKYEKKLDVLKTKLGKIRGQMSLL